MYSTYSSDSWSTPVVVKSGLDTITDLSIGSLGNAIYISACHDDDCDLTTYNDIDLWLYTLSGESTRITDSEDAEGGINFVTLGGKDVLTYICDGNMYSVSSADDTPAALLSDEAASLDVSAKLISLDSGDSVILYTQNLDQASQIYTVFCRDGEWGSPTPVTNQEYYIKNADGVFVGNRLVTVFDRIKATITDESLEETYDLCWLGLESRMDLSVDDVYVDFDTISPGKTGKIEVYITNSGNLVSESVTATIKDGTGNALSHQTITVDPLLPGNSSVVDVSFTVPSTVDESELSVSIIDSGNSDANLFDNSAGFRIGYTDLLVETNKLTIEDEDMLIVSVVNNGCIASGGTLTMVGKDGTTVFSSEIPELKQYEMIHYTVQLNKEFYFTDKTYDVVTISVQASNNDRTEANNSSIVVLHNYSDYVKSITIAVEETTLTSGKTMNLTAKITPATASDTKLVWSSSDNSIASVDENGIVTGISAGTATILVSTEDGGVSVTQEIQVTGNSRLPGDVNSDGTVTLIDSTILRRWLANWSEVTINESNADVNADGKVTMMDSTILRRYLANWSGVELK